MAWAAGRAEVAKAELFALLTSHQQQIRYSDVRTAAISAISHLKLTKTDLKTIEQCTGDSNAGVRVAAADILAREDATRAGEQAADYLSDRAIYRRLLARDVEILPIAQKQADHAHYQAIVLPQLVDGDATDRLAEVAGNKDLPDGTRLGAIEGLSRIASAAARKHLVKIGKDDSGGEEICKAAWRGLRRSKRISAKKSS